MKVTALLVPPPGLAFVTVMSAITAVAMFAAGTVALSCVVLTNVVVKGVPSQFTTDPLMKFVPLTVKLNCDPPTIALVGEYVVNVGEGLVTAEFLPTQLDSVPDSVKFVSNPLLPVPTSFVAAVMEGLEPPATP